MAMTAANEALPESLKLLMARYPAFKDDAIIIANIGSKINHYHSGKDHTDVCINQCRVAWEWLNSIDCLIAYDYGLGAVSLCRNLFELVAGTIFLIENPNALQDFIDYGKVVAYEVVESMTQATSEISMPRVPRPDAKYLQALRAKSDYDNLKKRFGRDKWHGKSIKALAEVVGMSALYDSFYKETSAITHGDAYITLGYKDGAWRFSKDVRSWSSYCEAALDFSLVCMGTLYHRAVHKLKLPFVPDIQAVMGRLIQKGLLRLPDTPKTP